MCGYNLYRKTIENMPKLSSHGGPEDDEPDLNSTSTNTALLPTTTGSSGNNGYLWNKNILRTDDEEEVVDGPAGGASVNSKSDLVLMELGGNSPARVQMRGCSKKVGSGSGGAVADPGSSSRKGKTKSSICGYYWREYRCQVVMLIALIEFAILVAGVAFYSTGVLTATCDHAGRQGEATRNTLSTRDFRINLRIAYLNNDIDFKKFQRRRQLKEKP